MLMSSYGGAFVDVNNITTLLDRIIGEMQACTQNLKQ